MAADGTVCVAIGAPAEGSGQGFAVLRCSDGLVVDLAEFEAANNPDGLEVASDPFDVVADGDDGWFVSDAAANTVLRVARDGSVTVAAVFPSFGTFADGAEGRPAGLALAPAGEAEASSLGPRGGVPPQGGLLVALYNGALAVVRPAEPDQPGLGFAEVPSAIAAFATDARLYFLQHDGPSPGLFDTQRVSFWDEAGGTGFVVLPDGRFVVAVGDEGRLVEVRPSR